jgi:mannitol-1-phosphate 5-dehydrogenase
MYGGLAVIVGGGNVGIGVMLRSLRNAGYEVAVVTHRAGQAQGLRARGAQLQLTGHAHDRLQLAPCPAVASTEPRCVTELIRSASLVVVAVAAHHLSEAASLLAPGLARRRRPVNVLVCDNRLQAGSRLAREVALVAGDAAAARHGFVGLLLDQVATSGIDERGCLVHVEAKGRMFLDATGLRTEPPLLPGSLLVENHRAYVVRKLYLFSAGHAAGAFLGRLRGHTLMSDAFADTLVADLVRRALDEARVGLEQRYGTRFVGGDQAVRNCLTRYADPDLGDTTTRVARDPGRKLSADDRICGPAQLAVAAGTGTPALALVAAAGLCAHQGIRAEVSRDQVDAGAVTALMSHLSGLVPDHPFVLSVGSAFAELTHRGLVSAANSLAKPVPPESRVDDERRDAA